MIIKKYIIFIFFVAYLYSNPNVINGVENNNKIINIGERQLNIVGHNQMFSSRIQDGKNTQLLVVKNQDAFIRNTGKNSFSYIKPKNIEYELEDNCFVKIDSGKVVMISEECKNIDNKDNTIKTGNNDEFYSEKNIDCNKLKFDLINDIIINNNPFNGYQMQIYLRDFFNIIKLVLKRSNNDNKIFAFIYTNNNDFGCSPYYEYKIFIDKDDKEDSGQKLKRQNKKKKKIIAKSVNEYIDKLSTETYKNMLLSGYTYLKPAKLNTDTKKIVLQIKDSEVLRMSPIVLNVEWKQIGISDLNNYPTNIDILNKEKKRKQEVKKKNKNKQKN